MRKIRTDRSTTWKIAIAFLVLGSLWIGAAPADAYTAIPSATICYSDDSTAPSCTDIACQKDPEETVGVICSGDSDPYDPDGCWGHPCVEVGGRTIP